MEFTGLRALRTLNLSRNGKLVTLGPESLAGVNLTILDLSNGNLNHLQYSAFQNSSITEIDLSNNKIQILDRRVFSSMRTADTKMLGSFTFNIEFINFS